MNLEELDKNYKIHDKDTAEAFWKKYLQKDNTFTVESEKEI